MRRSACVRELRVRRATGIRWRRLLACCACAWLIPAGAAAAQAERAVDLELVLAADISGSMDLGEAAMQRRGFVEAFRDPVVVEAIRRGPHGRIAVSYIEWAGPQHQRTMAGWTEIADAGSAQAFAAALAHPEVSTAMWTSISSVIGYAALSFEANGFAGERRIIDISGDGPNNMGVDVVTARDRALARDIVINGLPIVNDRPGPYGLPPLPDLDLYYEDCVIGGPGAFLVVAEGFGDFARAIRRKLVLEIAGYAPPRPLFRPAAARPRPPCDAGERQLRRWMPDMD